MLAGKCDCIAAKGRDGPRADSAAASLPAHAQQPPGRCRVAEPVAIRPVAPGGECFEKAPAVTRQTGQVALCCLVPAYLYQPLRSGA